MAAIIKGTSTIQWGAAGVATISGVIQQGSSFKRKTEKSSVKDVNGITVSRIYYDPTASLSIKAVYNGIASEPAIGSTMSIVPFPGASAETNWIVEELDVEYANTNEVRLTLTLASYAGIPTP